MAATWQSIYTVKATSPRTGQIVSLAVYPYLTLSVNLTALLALITRLGL